AMPPLIPLPRLTMSGSAGASGKREWVAESAERRDGFVRDPQRAGPPGQFGECVLVLRRRAHATIRVIHDDGRRVGQSRRRGRKAFVGTNVIDACQANPA